MSIILDIGIFAYNEQARIKDTINDLAKQNIFGRDDISPRIHLLANGCTDATVSEAHKAVAELPPEVAKAFNLLDLDIKGKSRTWNHFVHSIARDDAEFLLFLDGDIRIPDADHVAKMLELIQSSEHKHVVNSRPLKDISLNTGNLNFFEKTILAFSGSLSNYKTSICGQMYLARRPALSAIYMPAGLPVEDGFLRAMVLTDLLTQPEDLRRIDGDENIAHTYESIRTLGELVDHQTRIVIGSAVNATLFRYLREHCGTVEKAKAELRSSADDAAWLEARLDEALPKAPYGYVPYSFLTKRIKNMFDGEQKPSLKLLVRATLGFQFDLIVYLVASYKMARGNGAGYW